MPRLLDELCPKLPWWKKVLVWPGGVVRIGDMGKGNKVQLVKSCYNFSGEKAGSGLAAELGGDRQAKAVTPRIGGKASRSHR